MESLLCDEVWLSSPETDGCCDDHHEPPQKWRSFEIGDGCSKEERYETNVMYLEKESCYLPEPGYVDYLLSNNDLMQSRSRAIQWFIKSRSRLNLSFVTVFNAVNYLDRFISMNHCQGWRYLMVELLSVACLAVASKFTETSAPSLLKIQEDLDYCFQPNTIKRMELTLLQALGWRLDCITTYSFVDLLISNLDSMDSHVLDELSTRVTKVLFGYMIDFQLLKYRPSVVAVSALWCSLEGLMLPSHAHLAHITKLFKHDQKDDVVKCHTTMKSRGEDPLCNIRVCGRPCYWPSSPVTVLLRERIDIYDCQVDLSMFKNIVPAAGSNLESCKKRRKK
uniref:Cyclin D7-1 n=1 Tax=Dimocarpus longan TaxID=128017 RepID=A0A8G0VSJ0_9ROSI|nr:cyclin D7-1 [Dimocarpus longan]